MSPLEKLAALESAYRETRTAHRKLVRHHKPKESIKRDELLYSIQSSNPSAIFSSLKRSKRSKAGNIQKLTVGDKVYTSDNVKDDFFGSISKLKTKDDSALTASAYFSYFSSDYLSPRNLPAWCSNPCNI